MSTSSLVEYLLANLENLFDVSLVRLKDLVQATCDCMPADPLSAPPNTSPIASIEELPVLPVPLGTLDPPPAE